MVNTALDYLSAKTCSKQELRCFLETKFSGTADFEQNIDTTLAYLSQHQFIHDVRLAQSLAQHYEYKGNQFIEKHLRQRKIAEKTITAGLLSIADELSRAWEEAKKKLRLLASQNLSETDSKATLVRFLIGRQFSLSAINHAIDKLTVIKPYQLKTVIPLYTARKDCPRSRDLVYKKIQLSTHYTPRYNKSS